MASAIVRGTIQSCVLTATSNILAQCISAYRTNKPYVIDWTPVFHFILFTALSSPPNYLWQDALESTFPGHYLAPSSKAIAAASASDEKTLDREEKDHTLLESHLHLSNTLCKFLLDQTVGAAWNTVIFSFVMAGLKGANYPQAWQITTQDFMPLIRAGWRLWPLVSLVNFTIIQSVQGRQLVGSLAGMGWNIYLSLVMGTTKEQ